MSNSEKTIHSSFSFTSAPEAINFKHLYERASALALDVFKVTCIKKRDLVFISSEAAELLSSWGTEAPLSAYVAQESTVFEAVNGELATFIYHTSTHADYKIFQSRDVDIPAILSAIAGARRRKAQGFTVSVEGWAVVA